ncbi:ATP phosphoribosyltransferase regulatory subunit [Marinovum sp.]|uniref:ATP phosphoribosyltransferase regulatory subunit n=1 Tax=Marinovum sp. TaxID=2024839 RepID=UPI002B26A4CC|nr:ATP phosphoribosyltransferase regulatory subunit [Marinovum sp.]
MPDRAAIIDEAQRLRAGFEASGARVVQTPVLQPAETLLDLYGEDIRGRAYVTADALRGEQMLRPDFTVPVVQMHMDAMQNGAAEPARYTYSGAVFRRQDDDPDRDSEYLQVGYEVFDRSEPALTEADVFARIAGALGDLPLRAATGDIGLLKAAVEGLDTTEARKAALRRHIWRPRRFRALLERFAGRAPAPAGRKALLAQADPMAKIRQHTGLRSEREIATRIAALREDAETPKLSVAQVDLIEALLAVRETLPNALERLRDIAVDLPWVAHAVDRLKARCEALNKRGVDVDGLEFEGSYGRTSMEYYDGFVFGLYAESRPDLPPVATGGRYDALTAALGGGRSIPAVGGVIRPGLVLQLRTGSR